MSPSWSAAGAARHYNLRLPTEGLRPGHGPAALGPAPGFKGLRLTAGQGALCSPSRLAVCSPKIADVSRMLPQVGPM